MQCIACKQNIHLKNNGFTVCPHCKTVNAPMSAPGPAPQKNTFPGDVVASGSAVTSRNRLTRRQKMFVSAATLAVILSVTAIGIFSYRHFYTLRNQENTGTQANQWAGVENKIQQAKEFIANGKLDEASALLDQVNTDYPGYSSVANLQKTIKDKKAEIAKKIAEEQTKALAQLPPPKTAQVQTSQTQSASPAPAFTTPIKIRGDSVCQSSTTEALKLISQKAPIHYATVTKYISIIECATQGSGMFAYETPPRYLVGDATRNAGTIWYAGTIVHDAGHSKLYHDYLTAHPGKSVPADIWTGESAERACLEVQYDALAKIGASQSDLNYVKNAINTQYFNVPYNQRWW